MLVVKIVVFYVEVFLELVKVNKLLKEIINDMNIVF